MVDGKKDIYLFPDLSPHLLRSVYARDVKTLTQNIIVYSGSAIITPAEPIFMEIFGVSAQVSTLVLSMYVLGYVS